jgi:hypothetical protein
VPSPFPGMDPYLEDPEIWRGLHHRLISAADDQLQPQLVPRGYYVDVESRIWLEEPDRAIYPDLALLKALNKEPPIEPPAGALVADVPVRLKALRDEVREDYLQIYEKDTGTLVTGIEFISPSNKSGRDARRLYIRKRTELTHKKVNLVEIDLLRAGRPLVRLPRSVLASIQSGGYVVNVVRARSPDYEFFPVDQRKRLPRIGIPLRKGEPDVVLDLQAALLRSYDAGAYSIRIDYNREPAPPLDGDTAGWAGKLLEAAGLRKPAGPSNGPDISSK